MTNSERFHWIGGHSDGNFYDPRNWKEGRVPTPGSTIVATEWVRSPEGTTIGIGDASKIEFDADATFSINTITP